MELFQVNILGCRSALPTGRHLPSSLVANVRNKLFMFDCGEGTQLQLRRLHLSFSRINCIFISHLHGDHCFGLPGLVATMGLLGRTATLHIYGPQGVDSLLRPLGESGEGETLPFNVTVHAVDTKREALIFEDRSVEIWSIPLHHRTPCCGYVLREKPLLPHIRRDMTDFYGIPVHALRGIKEGGGWTLPDGRHIPHEQLTSPAESPRSFAYCSDTMYIPEPPASLSGVDLLYHEATFAEADAARAAATGHSTARQAALVAAAAGAKRLLIGHFSARYDDEKTLTEEARAIFPETIAANEGLCIDVGNRR